MYGNCRTDRSLLPVHVVWCFLVSSLTTIPIAAQGYYLNYYHTAVSLRSGVRAVLPLGKAATEDSMGDPAFAIAIVMERVAGQSLIVDFFSWSVERNSIVTHPSE